MSHYDKNIHTWGKISGILGILMFLLFPALVSLLYTAWPDPGILIKGLLGVVPIFYTIGIIEAFTFAPMLGAGGTYLSFITGNITALKVPCALNAMQACHVEPGTKEGDVISTIAIGISSIVTTIILIAGMILLSTITPILESPFLAPAFANILPALFGGLAVVFIAKRPKIAVAPILLMITLFVLNPGLAGAVSLLVPVGAGFTILVSRILYKMGKL